MCCLFLNMFINVQCSIFWAVFYTTYWKLSKSVETVSIWLFYSFICHFQLFLFPFMSFGWNLKWWPVSEIITPLTHKIIVPFSRLMRVTKIDQTYSHLYQSLTLLRLEYFSYGFKYNWCVINQSLWNMR